MKTWDDSQNEIRVVMKFAIIAAGDGSRIAAEGLACPKPLVTVGGECLVDRLVRIFCDHGAEDVSVICNDKVDEVAQHLQKMRQRGLPVQFMVENTPSSMHSLYRLHGLIGDGKFCLTTVDTVFSEKEFTCYVDMFANLSEGGNCDALMGVTDFIDDEKPLYVDVDEHMNIKGFRDEGANCKYVSAGIYGLTPAVWPVLEECVLHGEQRMRNFQRALLRKGLRLKAFAFSKVIDVDHVADVALANRFILCHDA